MAGNRPKKSKDNIKLFLTIGLDTYEVAGEGENKLIALIDAISKFKVKDVKGFKGILRAEHQGKTSVTQINTVQLRKLFNFGGYSQNILRTIYAKRLLLRL